MLLRRSHRFPMQSAISNNRTAPRRLFRSTQSNVSSQCALPKKSPLKSVASSRSEEHTSELQSLMRISYAVFCLKKKKNTKIKQNTTITKQTTQTKPTHLQTHDNQYKHRIHITN